jgi:hypothetical protein
MEVQLHTFLTSALVEDDPGSHWIGSWLCPRASMNVVTKMKNPCPFWEWNPGHPTHSLVSIFTELLLPHSVKYFPNSIMPSVEMLH